MGLLSVWVALLYVWTGANATGTAQFVERQGTRAEVLPALSAMVEHLRRHLSLASDLALSLQNPAASEVEEEILRFSLISPNAARSIAYYDGAQSFFRQPGQVPSPASDLQGLDEPLQLWQVTRGLPVRLNGRLLNRIRRGVLAGC